MYRIQHQKHRIHKVDYNNRIILKEVSVDEFAVKLTLSYHLPPIQALRGGMSSYIQYLEDVKGFDIKLSDLIDYENRVTFVLGIAGIGKSVLVKQLASKWAKYELFKEFQLCISFACSQLNNFVVNKGKQLEKHELLNAFIKSEFDCDVESGKGVLFIVDGLDELYDINTNDSIISQLVNVKKSKYTKSKIIITGRPYVEYKLLQHGQDMGGVQKVAICGVSDEQINEYISSIASSNNDIAKIIKARDASKSILQFMHIPQFLNIYCCVTILPEMEPIQNTVELFCWTLLLLLKQHDRQVWPNGKTPSEIFHEYSKDILALSKICFGLLKNNAIVFEGDTEGLFGDTGGCRDFINELFLDVSDNFSKKKEFKQAALIEFLSAVYVCTTDNPMESIKDILGNEYHQVVLLYCQLISGIMYDGIIKDFIANAAKLGVINTNSCLQNILKVVREDVRNVDRSFRLSVDIILCAMNRDLSCRKSMISILHELRFECVGYFDETGCSSSSKKLINMLHFAIVELGCNDMELMAALEKVHFEEFEVDEVIKLRYIKYLASVEKITLYNIKTTVREIHLELSRVLAYCNCTRISISKCSLQDEEFEDEKTANSVLEWLWMFDCQLCEKSFTNVCRWVTSSFEEFRLWYIDIEDEWWKEMITAIVNAKVTKDLTLRKLWLYGCTSMNDEVKRKVRKVPELVSKITI